MQESDLEGSIESSAASTSNDSKDGDSSKEAIER